MQNLCSSANTYLVIVFKPCEGSSYSFRRRIINYWLVDHWVYGWLFDGNVGKQKKKMKEKGTTLWNQAWWYRETLLLMMFALCASIKEQCSCLRLHYCSCYPMIVTYQFSKLKWNNIAITSPALYRHPILQPSTGFCSEMQKLFLIMCGSISTIVLI